MKKNLILLLFFLISVSIFSNDIILRGQIVDENGKNIANSDILIKNNDNLFNIKSDDKGFFSKNVKSGITTVLVEKQGYFEKVLIKLIEKRSNTIDLKIKLIKKKYYIQGILYDGITALPEIKIVLKNSKGIKIKEVISTDEGDYEFVDIPGTDDLYIEVSDRGYHYFKSEPITLEKSLEHFHILLNKK